MAAKYSEEDEDSKYNVQLCKLDQNKPGSCDLKQCYDFHLCRDYLLENRCREFESNGKCSRSHSLFTQHNQRILEKKLNLSAAHVDTFDRISRLIKDSERSSPIKRSCLSSDDHEFESVDRKLNDKNNDRLSTTDGSVVLRNASSNVYDRASLPQSTSSFSSTNPDYSRHSISNPNHFKSSASIDLMNNGHNQYGNKKQSSMITRSLTIHEDDDIDENNDVFSSPRSVINNGKRFARSAWRSVFPRRKEKSPIKSNQYDYDRMDQQFKYVFYQYFQPDQLSYLFGPIRRDLNDRKSLQILPSGYCQLTNDDEEKEIQRRLQKSLPTTLKTNQLPLKDEFAFLISTSAGEKILEQNQKSYSIITEPYETTLSIEVIHEIKNNHIRSRSVPSKSTFSTRLSKDLEKPRIPLDGKFRITNTNSSIDVICCDITDMNVGLMVCVTTSITLLNSVLSKAGQKVASQFHQGYLSSNPMILDGGFTRAQKILFIDWKLEIQSSNPKQIEKSLVDLVNRCIEVAYQLNVTSISFPSIGTGQIGVDPRTVSEMMINAAVSCLDRYTMNVLFAIYPSTGNDHNQQSYRAFRSYLDKLIQESKSGHIDRSSVKSIPVRRSQHIHRSVEYKRISIVSDSTNTPVNSKHLLELFNKIIKEYIFDLSIVQKPFIDQIDLLIDLCLSYHVIPRIDFDKHQLILHGDQHSCLQCFSNLRNRRSINQYSVSNTYGGKTKMSVYMSLKIDEAFDNDQSSICIEDDEQNVFNIDLKTLNIRIDGRRDNFNLYTQQLNVDSNILLPTSWSPLSMIRTVQIPLSSFYSLDFLNIFEQTMARNEWRILRIDSIQNWPFYVQYSRKKESDEIIAFHGCSYSSVQSIIHYGLRSYSKQPYEKSIYLTLNALDGHIQRSRRSTDGNYYMFVVRLSKKIFNQDSVCLSNEDVHLVLPTHLIVYQR